MRVHILVFDGVADSGLGLLRDVFTAANLLTDRIDAHMGRFDVSLHATDSPVCTAYGLTAQAEPVASSGDAQPDYVLVPSLGIVSADDVVAAVQHSAAVDYLSAIHADGVAVAGACSGTFLLAEAGLLDGRTATTSWWLGPTFRQRYRDVDLDEARSLVISGDITTAGAALAHLDLALSLVRRVSPALSDAVGDYLAVGDRPQQSDLLRPSLLPNSDPVLTAFDRAVRDDLAEPVDVAKLASRIGVSQRTLQRLTSTTLAMTPVRYIQQVRVERAIDLLRTTDLSVGAVAHAVGYQDATTLGTLIRRARGTTPEQIRRRRSIDARGAVRR